MQAPIATERALDGRDSRVRPYPLGRTQRRASRHGLLGTVVAVTIGVVVSIAFVTLREPGVSFPETFGGLRRASDARSGAAAASFRAASEARGLDADMAFFAEGGSPVVALAWISGAERTGGAAEAFDGFTEDFTSGYNGSVATTERAESTVGGITYVCAPFVGPVSAGICVWEDGNVFWVLLDVRPGTTVGDARSLSVTARDAAT